MDPVIVATVIAAAALGGGIGWLQQHNLNRLSYRQPDEIAIPAAGRRTWVVWVSAAVWGCVAAKVILPGGDVWGLLPFLPLMVSGPGLAAVDFDVMRLPNRTLLPTGIAAVALLVAASVADSRPSMMVSGLIGLLITGGLFAGLAAISGGRLGGGDVKLAAVIGAALGAHSLVSIWLALLIGSIAAIAWIKAKGSQGPLPYGPWLLLGALVATLT